MHMEDQLCKVRITTACIMDTLDGEYGGEHTEIKFSVKEKAVDFLIGGVPANN